MKYIFMACVAALCCVGAEDVKIEQVAKKEFALRISQDEGKVIEEIVTTLGKNSLVSLGFKKGHLKNLGKQLRGIGCLQFLGYIFTKDELKLHMKAIQNSSFKWSGFMDGLKPGFEKEAKSNKLFEELPGFAATVHADYNKLLTKAKEGDWDEFVKTLIE